jgi:cardiolipin synthase
MGLHIHLSTILAATHLLVVAAIAIRVIMRRPARGVALAWLFFVSMLPAVGALMYLLIGERRIGRRRTHGIDALRIDYREIVAAAIPTSLMEVDWSRHAPAARGMDSSVGHWLSSTVRGSIFASSETQAILEAIARCRRAKTSVLMEF